MDRNRELKNSSIRNELQRRSPLFASLLKFKNQSFAIKFVSTLDSNNYFDAQNRTVSIDIGWMERNKLSINEALLVVTHELTHLEDFILNPDAYLKMFETLNTLTWSVLEQLEPKRDQQSRLFNSDQDSSKKLPPFDREIALEILYAEILDFWNALYDIQTNQRAIRKISSLNVQVLSDIYKRVSYPKDDYISKPIYQQIEPFLVRQNSIIEATTKIDPDLESQLTTGIKAMQGISIAQYIQKISNKQADKKFLNFEVWFEHFKKYILPFFIEKLVEYYKQNPQELQKPRKRASIFLIPSGLIPQKMDNARAIRNLYEQLKELGSDEDDPKNESIIIGVVVNPIGHGGSSNSDYIVNPNAIRDYNKYTQQTRGQLKKLVSLWSSFADQQIGVKYQNEVSTFGSIRVPNVIRNYKDLLNKRNQPKIYNQRQPQSSIENGEGLKELRITFVLDCSFSMKGAPIEELKKMYIAIMNSIEMYNKECRKNYSDTPLTQVLTRVIRFESEVEIIKPLSKDSSPQLKAILQSLSHIEACGCNSDHTAIKLVASEIQSVQKKTQIESGIDIILYVTDGRPDDMDLTKAAITNATKLPRTIWRGFYIGRKKGDESFNNIWNSDINKNISGISLDINKLADQITGSLSDILLTDK